MQGSSTFTLKTNSKNCLTKVMQNHDSLSLRSSSAYVLVLVLLINQYHC